MISYKFNNRARVDKLHDGDTTLFQLDLHYGASHFVWIRYLNVTAPELKDPGGIETAGFVADWFVNHAAHWPGKWPWYINSYGPDLAPKEVTQRTTLARFIGTIQCMGCEANLNEEVNTFLGLHPAWGPGI